MDTKQVSVIVPAYNAASYLRPAIESVLAQTYRDYEIIVVDDGSTDETPVIAQQFGNAIRYIRQKNMGLSAARNTGIRNAQAPVIALLDSDDVWEPEFLEVMLSFLNKHPQAAGAYCGFQYINSKGEIVGQPSVKVVPPEKFHEAQVFLGNWLAPCAVVFHKHLAEQVGLFDESLRAVEDTDLWIRLSTLRPFVGFPKALVRYRRHDSNMTKDPHRMVTAEYQVKQKTFGPAEGDRSSWPRPKVDAYISHFHSAAIRYMEVGNIPKCAAYLRELFLLSPDYLSSLELWRGLARAHVPQEYSFSSPLKLNWSKVCADFENLIAEFAAESNGPTSLNGQSSKIKAAAFLALADEAGRNFELQRAFEWIGRAMRYNPNIILSRPYWGTLLRSLTRKLRPLSTLD